MRLLLPAVLIFSISRLAFAETPAPSTTSIPSAIVERIVNDDLILLELEMAENGYTINKSLESATRLLSIMEKVLTIRCLSEALSTLARSNPSQDEACIEYANRAMRIDPGNVVALCVLNGLDSLICKAASEAQVLNTYDPKAEMKSQTASLDEVVASKRDGDRIRTQTIQLENKIRNLKSDQGRGINTLPERKALMSNILEVNCARPRVKLLELSTKTVPARSTRPSSLIAPDNEASNGLSAKSKAQATPDAFAQMLQEHFTTPTPVVVAPKSHRVYEVPVKCKTYIEDAFKMDQNIAAAYCHKWGFYSWQCLNAKRHAGITAPRNKEDSFTRPTGQIQKF